MNLLIYDQNVENYQIAVTLCKPNAVTQVWTTSAIIQLRQKSISKITK